MKNLNSSLGAENAGRAPETQIGVLAIHPLTKTKRKILWNRLRRLDKKISELTCPYTYTLKLLYADEIIKIEKLDQQRKETRNKLKGYVI